MMSVRPSLLWLVYLQSVFKRVLFPLPLLCNSSVMQFLMKRRKEHTGKLAMVEGVGQGGGDIQDLLLTFQDLSLSLFEAVLSGLCPIFPLSCLLCYKKNEIKKQSEQHYQSPCIQSKLLLLQLCNLSCDGFLNKTNKTCEGCGAGWRWCGGRE